MASILKPLLTVECTIVLRRGYYELAIPISRISAVFIVDIASSVREAQHMVKYSKHRPPDFCCSDKI